MRDVNRILARNVFDADAGCLNCAPPPDAAVAESDAGEGTSGNADERPPEPCDGQARVVGGDYYDVLPTEATAAGPHLLCVADISGKGLPASLSAAR